MAKTSYEEEIADARLAKAREKILKNFPQGRAALHWRHDSPNRLVSTCGRFAIERHGDGEGVRYTAKLQPNTIIGHRRFTADQAKEDCNRHASPLPLEPVEQGVTGVPDQPTSRGDREPGSDDDI